MPLKTSCAYVCGVEEHEREQFAVWSSIVRCGRGIAVEVLVQRLAMHEDICCAYIRVVSQVAESCTAVAWRLVRAWSAVTAFAIH